VEIRRMDQGQPGQKVYKTLSESMARYKWFTPVIPATWRSTKRRITVQADLGIKQYPVSKRAAGVVKCLPSNYKGLRSTSSTSTVHPHPLPKKKKC
jgi:hypothetical protein